MPIFKTDFLNDVYNKKYSNIKTTINDYIKAVFREKVNNKKEEYREKIKSGEKI